MHALDVNFPTIYPEKKMQFGGNGIIYTIMHNQYLTVRKNNWSHLKWQSRHYVIKFTGNTVKKNTQERKWNVFENFTASYMKCIRITDKCRISHLRGHGENISRYHCIT